jgi:hypothetical protein
MCPSKRAPPSLILSLLSSGTKRRATQKAAYVPRHISGQFFSGQFFDALLVESLAWVTSRFHQHGKRFGLSW